FRFTATGLGSFPIRGAHVKLTVGSGTVAPSVFGGTLSRITSNSWSEATTTYNTRPAIDGPTLDTVASSVGPDQEVLFDVSGAVTGDGTYNFALTTTNADQVQYNSREATAGLPQLVVDLGAPPIEHVPQLTITAPATGDSIFDDQTALFTA